MKPHKPIPNFTCPLCQSPLILDQKTWHCTAQNSDQRQHSFDVAKQGYVNLLPVQQKKSKNPGDSEESIQARQRFLQAGFYQPLRQAIIDMAKDILPKNATWLDIGCGEGFYTQGFLSLNPANLIALDISKPAVLTTAKTLKSVQSTNQFATQVFSLVASASQVPLTDNSVDVISSIFSPILPQEFSRLLGEKGIVLIAKPAENHLYQMREGLFDEVLPHDSDKFIEELAPFFSLTNQQTIGYDIKVNAEQLADLLTMTPYSYRAKPEKRQALLAKCERESTMKLTIDFVIYVFSKT